MSHLESLVIQQLVLESVLYISKERRDAEEWGNDIAGRWKVLSKCGHRLSRNAEGNR